MSRLTRRLALASFSLLLLRSAPQLHAQGTSAGYTLKLIAKPGDVIGGVTLSSLRAPSLNNNGTVAFSATYPGGSGIFTQNGAVAKPGDTIGGLTLTSVGTYPSLNDSGAVAFTASFTGPCNDGILTQNRVIAKTGDNIGGITLGCVELGSPSLNKFGVVAFSACGSDVGGANACGIFTQNGVVALSGTLMGISQRSVGSPLSLNNSGTVAFFGEWIDPATNTVEGGVFTQNGLVAGTGDTIGGITLFSASYPSLNNNGAVAFTGIHCTDPSGRGCTGALILQNSIIAKPGDTIGGITLAAVGQPSLNDQGTVAFTGAYSAGCGFPPICGGIFTQKGVVAKSGDTIGGITLTSFTDTPSINNNGTIAFSACDSTGAACAIYTATPPGCGQATFPVPASQARADAGWNVTYQVTPQHGLEIDDVSLGSRYMAKEMNLPYIYLQTTSFPRTRCVLTPDGSQQAGCSATTRLVDFKTSQLGVNPLEVKATYEIDNITSDANVCVLLNQDYTFSAPISPSSTVQGCEPSNTLTCARFSPTVSYQFYSDSSTETLTSINTAQRMQFAVDAPIASMADSYPAATTLIHDCDLSEFPPIGGCGSVKRLPSYLLLDPSNTLINNPLQTEVLMNAVSKGGTGQADNFHQTNQASVVEPGAQIPYLVLALLPTDPYLAFNINYMSPGCPECVHIHWRWSTLFSQFPSFFGGNTWGNGAPLIPAGSNQDVNLGVVRYHPGEEDPDTFVSLLDAESLIGQPVVFWYSAKGYSASDTFFSHGGFFLPANTPIGPNITVQPVDTATGGVPVTVTFSSVTQTGITTVTSSSVGNNPPPGFTVGNPAVYFDIRTTAQFSGSIQVCITYSGVTFPTSTPVRLFHFELNTWVDRTSSIDTVGKVVCGTVSSLSPFAIFQQFDTTPPVIVPTISGASGNNGWYRSIVTVMWSVTDPESGIVSSSGCSATSLTANTSGVTLTCSATNGVGLSSSASITIKIDMAPPSISGMPAASCSLWPPNHKFVQVADVKASDAPSGVAPGSFKVTGTSNEPSTDPQIIITPDGSGGFTVQLQAERLGTGNGRVYTLAATAMDLAGNTVTNTATCTVPHDQGH